MKSERNERMKARVCEIQRDLFKLECEQGEVTAKLKGTFYKNETGYPVIGDYVIIQYNNHGDSLIEKILERKSAFSRTDLSGHKASYAKTVKEQVIAANFDYVFIVASLNHEFNTNRLTRYISCALQSGAQPVVILTKADLCQEIEPYLEAVRQISEQVELCPISAKTGQGMDQLEKYLTSETTIVFLGSSGVGKSTLVNAIAGEDIMKISEIRESDSRGRHTTTHRQLIRLASGVTVIDTPGIRELGLWDAQEGISQTFSDVTELFEHCKFRNCSHRTEAGCAVLEALDENKLSKDRWKLYRQLSQENEWGQKKSAYTVKQKLRLQDKKRVKRNE